MISFLIIPVHARIRPVEIGPAAVKPLQDIVNLCFLYAVTRAKKKALHLLERMDRTEQQLRTKLTEGGYPSEIVEQTLEYVKGFHYIDDVRYARTYMEYRKTGRSLRQMERELYQKGISRADFQKASEEMEAPDEEQQVRQWIMKKRFDAETADRQERDRLIRFLLRRGYGMAVIQRVLRGSEEIE